MTNNNYWKRIKFFTKINSQDVTYFRSIGTYSPKIYYFGQIFYYLENLHQNFNYRSYLEINNNYINRIFNANVINNILILSFDLKQNISLTIGEYLFKNISIDFDFSIFFTSKVFEDLKTNIRISVQPRTISIDSFIGEGCIKGITSYFVLFIPLKLNINKK